MNNAFNDAIVSAFTTAFSSSAFKTCLLLSFSFYSCALAFRVVKLLCYPPRRREIQKDVNTRDTENQTTETNSVAGIAGTASGRGVNQGFTCDLPKPCKVHMSCSDCLIYHEGVSCYGITE